MCTSLVPRVRTRAGKHFSLLHPPSLSGYESESPLVSQSSIETADTQMVISLNSSIARFILMLDIWISQVGGAH